jgi:hypothetical protein
MQINESPNGLPSLRMSQEIAEFGRLLRNFFYIVKIIKYCNNRIFSNNKFFKLKSDNRQFSIKT